MNTFDYFKQICAIPRESENEEGMRQFLLSWAKENNFKAVRDKAGNIIIYRDATPGFENVEPVALQGHMDMVCVKKADCVHDFTKDPIEVYQDGDRLRARGTSLGGDNGIAVAMVMALFTDPTAKHGKLEAVFTFSEETGMDGAFALDGSLISSKKLINMDSEEEGIIYIGCAGGIEIRATKKMKFEALPSDWEPVFIKVDGLLGGHSGGEIHLQRANAISVLARMLFAGESLGYGLRLATINGGTKKNVIPSEAECVVCIPSEHKKEIMHKMLDEFEAIKAEYSIQDPGMNCDHHCSHCDASLARPEKVFTVEETHTVLSALFACPHGVYSNSLAVPGVIETSNNLAIVNLNGDELTVISSIRSLRESAKYLLLNKIQVILESFGFTSNFEFEYPSWTPNPDSELAQICAKAWKEQTGNDAVLTSIHAGLECGVINSKVEGMDSVSIGPDLRDVHSVNESLSVSSTKRLYDFVKKLLEKIK